MKRFNDSQSVRCKLHIAINYPEYLEVQIEKSWDKIFDMDFESPDICVSFKERKFKQHFWN